MNIQKCMHKLNVLFIIVLPTAKLVYYLHMVVSVYMPCSINVYVKH